MDLDQVPLCESIGAGESIQHRADESLAQGDAGMVSEVVPEKAAQCGRTEMCLIVLCVGQLMR